MTRFSLTGHHNDLLLTITWDDGKLYGPPEAVDLIQGLAKHYDAVPIGTTVGGDIVHVRLTDPRAAYVLMNCVFSDDPTVRGDLPEQMDPQLPPGAIL